MHKTCHVGLVRLARVRRVGCASKCAPLLRYPTQHLRTHGARSGATVPNSRSHVRAFAAAIRLWLQRACARQYHAWRADVDHAGNRWRDHLWQVWQSLVGGRRSVGKTGRHQVSGSRLHGRCRESQAHRRLRAGHRTLRACRGTTRFECHQDWRGALF